MKREAMISLSAAVLSLAFLPAASRAWASSAASDLDSAGASAAVQTDAQKMAPAQAVLDKTLDAKKLQPGQQFQAKLNGRVKLKDGQELPSGTILVGTITTDNMQSAGKSSLALQFTEARLKDGKTLPIEATIIGIAPAGTPNYGSSGSWTPQTLQVDQIGAIKGADLHSKIDGANSGVFVAAKMDDLKLSQGSELSLAIAAKQDLTHPYGD